MKTSPIFIKAIPRSGGTLLTTLLDAHPNIAMSYEIYEDSLSDDSGRPLPAEDVLGLMKQSGRHSKDDVQWIKKLPHKNLQVFLFRAKRGGLSIAEILEVLKEFVEVGNCFTNSAGRLSFIEMLMQAKARKYMKSIWGGKTQADLCKLHDRYPDACFFIMRRDPRDMFASMQNRGSFTYAPKQAAGLWRERILGFREFVKSRSPRAMEICYERLVRKPETVLCEMCCLLGIVYDASMLSFHKKNMSLFENPHGHLSSEQLKQGLNANSIGRWQADLSAEDADTIMSIAGDLMDE